MIEKAGFILRKWRVFFSVSQCFVVQANKFTGHGYYTILKVSFASRGNFHSGALLLVFQFCEGLVITVMCHELKSAHVSFSNAELRTRIAHESFGRYFRENW